jgi:DNA-binding IclR family transcriptional regulator
MAGNSAEVGRTVTSKIAVILAVFTTGRTHSLATVAGQAKLPTSTAYRLLLDLVGSGLLERTECGGYQPGIGLRHLVYHNTAPALRDRGPLVVDDLCAALVLPARLGVLEQLEVAYIEKRPGPFPGTSFPNKARLPLHASALGKILLAHGPRTLVQLVLASDLPRYTPRTMVGRDQLQHALNLARATGFAISDRELDQAVSAVAVPVFDRAGLPIAALEAHVPRLCRQAVAHVVPALMLAARGLGREVDPGDRSAPHVRPPSVRRRLDLPTAL